jgi:hypothetical protein
MVRWPRCREEGNPVTPRYRLISYNRTTDRIGGIIDIPAPLLKQVLAIAGIAMSASELGEHALTGEQVRDISSLIGVGADAARFHYHLEPIEPGVHRLRA